MTTRPKHLVIQAHGLFGNIGNWKVINEHFKDAIDTQNYLLYPSEVNQYRKTFEGIDVCGERLADEIKGVVNANPGLKYISMIGHSMGGLLIRYAAGKLYDPYGGTIAGLEPIHFICMATPHLGCDSSGEGQVPVVGWMFPGKVSAGGKLDKLVSHFSKKMFSTAGAQLFMNDRTPAISQAADSKPLDDREIAPVDAASTAADHHPPLIAKLAFDVPNEGLFISALQSFKTRMCYGNAANDHIVGWANSTLRYADELPDIGLNDKDKTIKGVVHEDPIENAWLPPDQVEQRPLPVRRDSGGKTSSSGSEGASKKPAETESQLRSALIAATAPGGAQSSGITPTSGASSSGDVEGSPVEDAVGVEVTHSSIAAAAMKIKLQDTIDLPRAAVAAVVLERLRFNTSWSRVDCAWRDSRFSMFAHNLIQVTREWLNSDGKSVCVHLAKRFGALEDYVRSSREDY